MSAEKLHVLVVDDSAVVRQALSAILTLQGFDVTTAADPIIAGERLRSFTPDVIMLDLEMPRMDGLSFLSRIMQDDPLPVIICSVEAGRGTEKALLALSRGAVDIVAKPRIAVREFLYEAAVTLTDAVRAAAAARVPKAPRATPRLTTRVPSKESSSGRASTEIIAIGASTGGTDALRVVLSGFEENAPGVVIVQHMPRHFTRVFAQSLDRDLRIHVREAADGDLITSGTALIAPGDHHLSVRRARNGYAVEISDGPFVSRHRPSVDVLFHSVARVAGASSTGVILTGMGDDGAAGLLEMRRRGARTIAQDESSSVVFGMPKEAIAAGAVERVVPLAGIAAAIVETRKGQHG